MNPIVQRIFDLLSEKKIKQKDFAEAIGEAPQTVSDWKKGRNDSYRKHIGKIASFLDVSVDYLLCRDIVTIDEDDLRTILVQMSESEIDAVLDYARYLLWKRNQAT